MKKKDLIPDWEDVELFCIFFSGKISVATCLLLSIVVVYLCG